MPKTIAALLATAALSGTLTLVLSATGDGRSGVPQAGTRVTRVSVEPDGTRVTDLGSR